MESRDPFSLQGTHWLQVQTSSKYAVLKHQVNETVSSKVGQSWPWYSQKTDENYQSFTQNIFWPPVDGE